MTSPITSPTTSPTTFTFQAAFALGYATFKSHYGALLGASVVFTLVLMGVSFLQELLAPGLGILMHLFLDCPLWAGLAVLAVRHIRGESPELKTLFAGFTRYWPLVGIGVLFMLILWLVPFVLFLMLVLALGDGIFSIGVIGVFTLASLGYAVFFAVWLLFVPMLCLDPRRQLGIRESFATSWKRTAPVFWPLLGLYLVLLFISAVTLILLLLPFIFIGFPLAVAVTAAAYELIIGEADMDEFDA